MEVDNTEERREIDTDRQDITKLTADVNELRQELGPLRREVTRLHKVLEHVERFDAEYQQYVKLHSGLKGVIQDQALHTGVLEWRGDQLKRGVWRAPGDVLDQILTPQPRDYDVKDNQGVYEWFSSYTVSGEPTQFLPYRMEEGTFADGHQAYQYFPRWLGSTDSEEGIAENLYSGYFPRHWGTFAQYGFHATAERIGLVYGEIKKFISAEPPSLVLAREGYSLNPAPAAEANPQQSRLSEEGTRSLDQEEEDWQHVSCD